MSGSVRHALGRRGRRNVLVVAWLLAGVVLASCTWNPDVDTRSATQGLPNTEVDLVEHAWRLDAASSTPRLKSLVGGDAGAATLDFHADGTVSGHGPCNSFHADFDVDGDDDTLTITKVAATTMACGDAAMDDETAFHEALELIGHAQFSADHDTLTLTGAGGTRLVFASYDPDE